MNCRIVLTTTLLFCCNMVFSQTIKGIIVINEVTQKPVSTAMISNERTQLQQYTDENAFVPVTVPLDKNRITISRGRI